MINTVYYHGDDEPARDLAVGQVRAALLDLAGTLWLDLDSPTDDEIHSGLVGAFDLQPRPAAVCRDRSRRSAIAVEGSRVVVTLGAAASAKRPPETAEAARPLLDQGESSALTIWLGPNFIVTCGQEANGLVDDLRTAADSDPFMLADGADRLVARLLHAAIDGVDGRADQLESKACQIEERVMVRPRASDIAELAGLKLAAGRLVRELAPLSVGAAQLGGGASPAVRDVNRVYYDAAADRSVRLLERARRLEQVATDTMGVHTAIEASRARRALDRLLVVGVALLAFSACPALARLAADDGIRSVPLVVVGMSVVMAAAVFMLWWTDRR